MSVSVAAEIVADVVVAGGGPAGWSTARACAEVGLDVVLVDPRPDAAWPQIYGSWEYELPTDLPLDVVAARALPTAAAVQEHTLADPYVMLDTGALAGYLRHSGVRVHADRVVGVEPGPAAVLAGGTRVRGRVVLDGTGSRQVLSRRRRRGGRTGRGGVAAEQTAYGVVVDDATAAPLTQGRMLFMDWRPRHGRPGWPTFLYGVPLGGGRVLLEETSLARRPALPLAELRDRLHRRLRTHGVPATAIPDGAAADAEGRIDRVRFAVDRPLHRPPDGVVALGAAAPLVHPATGYSLAASLGLAPLIAGAVVDALGSGAVDPARAVREVACSRSALAVHGMRRRGLDVLLRLPPARVPAFFDRFFALPDHHRRAYLSSREDVATALAAMCAVFAGLDPALRLHLIAGTLLGPGHPCSDQRR